MKNILLRIRYDGSNFSGWQIQPEKRTVQGDLEQALSHVFSREINIQGTSRTDRGVHALGQCANFQLGVDLPTEKIPMIVNNLLKGRSLVAPDLEVISAEEVDEDFHARFNAVGKRYIYKILFDREPDIFKRNYFYQIEGSLDLSAMETAAADLLGKHDFRSFMAAGSNVGDDTERTIYKACFHRSKTKPNLLTFEIVGNGFLYNMVRIIVGTLVDIGSGKIPMASGLAESTGAGEAAAGATAERAAGATASMKAIIEGRDRSLAGHTAPPGGLYLDEIFFSKEKVEEIKRSEKGKQI